MRLRGELLMLLLTTWVRAFPRHRPVAAGARSPSRLCSALVSGPILVEGLSCDPVTVTLPSNHYGLREIVILEASASSQEALVEKALELTSNGSEGDPYGSVLWPAAKTLSKRLLSMDPSEMQRTRILELGSGTGLVSIVAALCGAKQVIATDFNPFTLRLIERSAKMQTSDKEILSDQLQTQLFDVCDFEAFPDLPSADLLLIADLLYSPATGEAVAKRIHQAVKKNMRVIIADSPLRPGRPRMIETLSSLLKRKVEFFLVKGEPVREGVRHELISVRDEGQDGLKTLDMAVLEL